jgi:S1-C subfamily serine protease
MSHIVRQIVPWLILAGIGSMAGQDAHGQDCSSQATQSRQAVVSLRVKKTKKETGQVIESAGTGFIVSPQGYVLTAAHVLELDSTIDDMKIEGSRGSLFAPSTPLRFVDDDKQSDIALLQFLDSSQLYIPVPLGNPWIVPIGAPLCSVGFSAQLNADYRSTTGSLSALTGQDPSHAVNNLWTTQIPSNVGESGAPVLHLPGRTVVAIKYGGERVAQNVNYVIPLNLAQPLLFKYAGILLPHLDLFTELKARLEKVVGDKQVIPVGGWQTFQVKVVGADGKPMQGAKVAWQTPTGGALTFVAETDQLGIASAMNLYTFATAGSYLQTARIVNNNTPTGFIQADKIQLPGPSTLFTFQQK